MEINNGNKVNEPSGKHLSTRSTFKIPYHNFQTHRFGEITPHFVMEGVSSDELHMRSSHTLRSFTMQAPLLEDIGMTKAYFNVPMTAILPLNWQKFYDNPTIGQDVPSDCGPASTNFYTQVGTIWSRMVNKLSSVFASGSSASLSQRLTCLLRFLVVGEFLFSDGSLLASLGVHLNSRWFKYVPNVLGNSQRYRRVSFDEFFDSGVISCIREIFTSIQLQFGTNQYRTFKTDGLYVDDLDLHDLFTYLRDEPGAIYSSVSYVSGKDVAAFNQAVNDWLQLYSISGSEYAAPLADAQGNAIPFNTSRFWAYHLVCAHFFTNDKIDYIFDANLFRQYIDDLYRSVDTTTSNWSFTVNGLTYYYDALSAHNLDRIMVLFSNAINNGTVMTNQNATNSALLGYFAAFFSFHRSLRFKDYFTGSRSQPLAVGNVAVNVDSGNNTVSVIDITRNIQRQRFLNAVNRVGSRFQEYMKEMFGKSVAPDFTLPFYLGLTSDVIFGAETENTADAQQKNANSVTTNLRSNGSRYEFTMEPERDCVLIGVTYYDIARAYSGTIDRQTMHLDRFDYFNKYMQFIGDQPVNSAELNIVGSSSPTFGYQIRHAEYKQRVNEISGGFVRNLPGWAFIADLKERTYPAVISPDYIRSLPSELDRYYQSLTGFSNGTYFHFIVKNVNEVSASRPMAYTPGIL